MARRNTPPLPNSDVPELMVQGKPRRFWLYAPFVLVALSALVWTGYWFWLRDELIGRMETATTQLRQSGYEVTWAERRIGGYPFRLAVTLSEVRAGQAVGWQVAIPRLETEAFLHSPDHWVMAAPEGLRLAGASAVPITIRGKTLRASLNSLDKTPPSFSLEGIDLIFETPPGTAPPPLNRAARLEFYLRPGPDDQGAAFFKLEGNMRSPRGGSLGQAPDQSVSILWNSTFSHVSRFSGSNWTQAVKTWSEQGGQIAVREANLRAHDLDITAQPSELGIDRTGRLTGVLDVTASNLPQALAQLASHGLIDSEAALASGLIAKLQQDPPTRASLRLQGGKMSLGPVIIADAPRLY